MVDRKFYGADVVDPGRNYGAVSPVFVAEGLQDEAWGYNATDGLLYHKTTGACDGFFGELGSVVCFAMVRANA